jgi:hypothetical protein
LAVAAVVVGGNAPYLLHIFNPNPLNLYSGLVAITHPGLIVGSPSADPNSGITAQALGHLAAVDWLHGHVPWWNPYEGLGAPLAGEMQSAALFPPVLLLFFSNGQVYFHLLLELVAGFSTYLLLHRLRVGRSAAVGGACAFALCGTFAWFSHAPANPVAFLPLLLLGIEYATGGPTWRRLAWVTVALALALSLYAGFPETAYIDGVLAALWAVARGIELPSHQRTRFALTILAGAGVGVLVAAPILVAFGDYLPTAATGGHNGTFGGVSLPSAGTPQVFLPYIYGPIDAFSSSDVSGVLRSIWGSVGGYLTASLLMLGTVGLFGRRHRVVRGALVVWLFLALGRTFGFPLSRFVINALPGMKDVAFYRYSPPTWTLALVVLAAFGFDDLVHHHVPRWWVLASGAFSVMVVALSATQARPLLHRLVGAADHRQWALASVGWALAAIGFVIVAALFLRGRTLGLVVLGVLVLDSLGMFVVPQLSAPRSVAVYPAPVAFLARHLGSSRFFTLGPLPANYGSYFALASLNSLDLPEPKRYESYVQHHLGLPTGSGPAAPIAAATFEFHLKAFEASGVKYLLTASGFRLPVASDGNDLKLVFAGPSADIYQLPSPGTLYGVNAGHCRILGEEISTARLVCSTSASLIRRELSMNGWSATVNGRPVPITTVGVFQEVRVGTGRSVVTFTFTPPFTNVAVAAFLLGLLLVGGGLVGWHRGRDRQRPIASD